MPKAFFDGGVMMASDKQRNSKALLKQASTVYPRIVNLSNHSRERIDAILKRAAFQAIPDWDPGTSINDATNSYSVMVNQNDVLSVKFDAYFMPEMAAHGATGVSSANVDLKTGHSYRFYELFKKGSDYQMQIDQIINEQIMAQQIPMLKPFEGVGPNEMYYLTTDTLVIYYQPYEYTPGYYGVLEFKIPYTQIQTLINPRGPIGRILSMPV
jgi:hypothetical protein